MQTVGRAQLEQGHLAELHELARERAIPRFRLLRRQDLIEAILTARSGEDVVSTLDPPLPAVEVEDAGVEEADEQQVERHVGVLDLVPDGYGFLRVEGLSRSSGDVYVSRSHVRASGLRSGDEVAGTARPPGRSDRYPSLVAIDSVNGRAPDEHDEERPSFSRLTPTSARERLTLAAETGEHAVRMVELLAPLAKGQRCLIASPPGAGATTLLRGLARAVAPAGGVAATVLLIDARPEEVAEWRLSGSLPVYATDSDRSPEAHVRLAELALERAKRLVEQGRDAVLLLDSITRLARAYRLLRPRLGRGAREEPLRDEEEGIEASAVRAAKRWFAAARNTEEQGSLTILATVRTDSESPFEQLLWDALGDTASAQLRLDGELAAAGLFPPLDVARSRSHGEEAILGPDETDTLRRLRDELHGLPPREAWQMLSERSRDI